ncbi:hypothetical protein V7S43_017301 [Phytophthora oleae]|uniref:Uncharacterized protein n=1 Tax=Phytophthora oleae TaxID=2107226 RepID=A0ABD3ETE2_9STRA
MDNFGRSFKLKFGQGRLPSLVPPAKDGQRDGTSPRRLAPVFTRKREPADTQAALLSVLVPLTRFIEDSKTSTSPASANAAPQTLSSSETKTKL